MKGVTITRGPQPWQILQQRSGAADIPLAGTYEPYVNANTDTSAPLALYARVVRENDGSQVCGWRACEMDGAGGWSGCLRDVPAGGLYRLETCLVRGEGSFDWAMRGDMVPHIGVGDVFLIAGQSNAAGYGRGEVDDPVSPMVHMLRLSGTWDMACHPLNDSTGCIFPACAATHQTGVSAYIAFGRLLAERLGHPIGLIPAALGASSLDDWGPESDLYRELIARKPLVGDVRALLWHQGCGDTTHDNSRSYARRFAAFVERLRADWANDIDVLLVQIGCCSVPQDEEGAEAWSYMRDVQRKLPGQVRGVYMVPSYDLPRGDPIHISAEGQRMLGRRLAQRALACLYGLPVCAQAPELTGMTRLDGDRLLLTFAPLQGTLAIYADAMPKALFQARDEEGDVPVVGYGYRYPDGLILSFARAYGDAIALTYLPGIGHAGPYPVDSASLLPIVPFHRATLQSI